MTIDSSFSLATLDRTVDLCLSLPGLVLTKNGLSFAGAWAHTPPRYRFGLGLGLADLDRMTGSMSLGLVRDGRRGIAVGTIIASIDGISLLCFQLAYIVVRGKYYRLILEIGALTAIRVKVARMSA